MKKIILTTVIFLFSFVVFTYKISESTSFQGDLARDLYEILKISNGDFTLLGPKSSFGGIYTTPYYFYLFLPVFILTGKSIIGVIYFNAFLFSFSLAFFTYFLVKKNKSFLSSLLVSLSFILFPFIIFSGRNPGNGFSHIPFFLIFLTIIYFFDVNQFKIWQIIALGFLFGFIVSMQFSYLPLIVPILIYIFSIFKNKKLLIIFMFGFFLAFSPLIIFELKNNFVMFKNTFIDRSYLSFIENRNLPENINLNKINQLSLYLNINIILVFIFILTSLILFENKKIRTLNFSLLLASVLLFVSLRFQYSFHYLFPFLSFLSFCFLITIEKLKINKLALIILILLLILNYPRNYYQKTLRSYKLAKNRVEKLLSNNLIKKNDKLNILLIRSDDAPVSSGDEYRFFLAKYGYNLLNQFEYPITKKLIIFNEKINTDIRKINNWELSQFSLSKLKSTKSILVDENMKILVLEK